MKKISPPRNIIKLKIWDFLAWIILAGIFIWLVLKVFGIINTPEILTYSPAFGAVYLAGWAMSKLNRASDDIKDIQKNLFSIERRTQKVEMDVGKIEMDVDVIKRNCPAIVK